MFTLKHITDSGDAPYFGEALYSGTEVIFRNGDTADTIQVAYLDGKEWESLRYGIVYVMNEAGKTVATYDMTRSSKPMLGPDDAKASLVGTNIRAA